MQAAETFSSTITWPVHKPCNISPRQTECHQPILRTQTARHCCIPHTMQQLQRPSLSSPAHQEAAATSTGCIGVPPRTPHPVCCRAAATTRQQVLQAAVAAAGGVGGTQTLHLNVCRQPSGAVFACCDVANAASNYCVASF